MASNYNSRLKPAEVAFYEDQVKLISKRESFAQLIQNQIFEDF
jgi:diaminopimelate decarboxylase